MNKNGIYNKKVVLAAVAIAFFFVVSGLFSQIVPHFSNYALQQGEHYFNGGEYDLKKAEKFYKIAKVLDSKNYLADYQLARIHFVENKLDLAKAEIDSAIAKNPENKRSFYIRGLIDGYAKNYAEAQEDFQKFVEWSPEEWAGYNDLAWVYFEDGKFSQAAEATEDGLLIAPENPWLLNGAGVSYQAMGDFQKAQEHLGKVKEIATGMSAEDWGVSYPGNSPENYPQDLAKFRDDVNSNLVLAIGGSKQKGMFHSACAASRYYACSGDGVSGVCARTNCIECDSDADRNTGVVCCDTLKMCDVTSDCRCNCDVTEFCGEKTKIPCGGLFCGRFKGEAATFRCEDFHGTPIVLRMASNPLCSPSNAPVCGPSCSCDPAIAPTVCLGTPYNNSCGSPVCPGTRNCTPANRHTEGWFDSATCDALAGWAFDPDAPNTPVDIHFYVDGPAGSALCGINAREARLPRSDLAFIGNIYHAFHFDFAYLASRSPACVALLKDGNPHTIYAYAIDTSNDGAYNSLLSGSPKSLTCPVAPSCACDLTIAPTVCQGIPYNDSCGNPICFGSKVCSSCSCDPVENNSHCGTYVNGCGAVCNGKTKDCSASSDYCLGTQYPSSNGCGMCDGTQDCKWKEVAP